MRVTVMHNEDAGSSVEADAIRVALERQGHQLVRVVQQGADTAELFAEPTDLVVAAGGDGTVACAVRLLAGSGVPFAVLPLGTANNVALALDATGDMDEIIGSWTDAAHHPIDLGTAHGPWGTRRFLEGVGVALVAETMDALGDQELRPGRTPSAKLARALRRYRETLQRLEPARWRLQIDDETIESEYLLVEILNIASVGPNLIRSPEADPSDGLLSVLLVGSEGRGLLLEHIARLLEGARDPLPVPARRARRVLLGGTGRVHVDDEVFEIRAEAEAAAVVVDLEPAALIWLGAARTTRALTPTARILRDG